RPGTTVTHQDTDRATPALRECPGPVAAGRVRRRRGPHRRDEDAAALDDEIQPEIVTGDPIGRSVREELTKSREQHDGWMARRTILRDDQIRRQALAVTGVERDLFARPV